MTAHQSKSNIDQLAVVESTVQQAWATPVVSQQSQSVDQSNLLYSLPQEVRDEIYKYSFEPRIEIRVNRWQERHQSLDVANSGNRTTCGFICTKHTVTCALLPVSKSIYEEVWRLLVPARLAFSDLFTVCMEPCWELAPLVAAFGPRIRYVYETGSSSMHYLEEYLPDSLIVLIDDFVLTESEPDAICGMLGDEMRWDTEAWASRWYDEARCLLDLKTFNIEVRYDEVRINNPRFPPRLIAALRVGKTLLEEKSVKAVRLLLRERVETSTWQEIFEQFFGPINGTEDIDPTPQCDIVPLVREFDVVDVQPWSFENDMRWFSDEHKMEQVLRVTRWNDTRLGSATYDSCTAVSCDLHVIDELFRYTGV